MKREDLLAAIGNIDQQLLLDSEKPVVNRRTGILWKAALVVAVISCLAITAAAAAGGGIWGRVEQEESKYITEVNGQVVEHTNENALHIYIDLPMDSNAPDRLQQFYAPSVLENDDLHSGGYGMGSYSTTAGEEFMTDFVLAWKLEDFSIYEYVEFTQMLGWGYNLERPVDVLHINMEIEHSSKTFVWDDQEYFLVSHEQYMFESTGGTCTQRLYWTDGQYIFRLVYPYWLEENRVRQIVESLEPVDDIMSYFDILEANGESRLQDGWEDFLSNVIPAGEYTFSAQVNKGWMEVGDNGAVQVYAELPLREDAPEIVEWFVYPKYFDDKELLSSSSTESAKGLTNHTIRCEVPAYGEGEYVLFSQSSCDDDQKTQRIGRIIDAQSVNAIQGELLTLGDHTFYQISYAKSEYGTLGRRALYWTDGYYIYTLSCPYTMENTEILEIIESIDGV